MKIKQMDKATLLELAWRDFLFWPFVRPLGIGFEYIRSPLARAAAALVSFLLNKKNAAWTSDILRREIFTLANVITIYGLFLWMELLYLMWAWWHGQGEARIISISSALFGLTAPDLWTMSLLTIEIFITDLVDGPSARVNDSVTALGTMLDHTRDYLAALTALCLLVAVTIKSKEIFFLMLLSGSLIGFLLVLIYHIKFMRLFARTRPIRRARDIRELLAYKLASIRTFALGEYQTTLTGRIQFGALACGIGCGLFYYATGRQEWGVLFGASLVISIMATFYYLYELWGEYYKKWQDTMKSRSQRMKERLVDRIQKKGSRRKDRP